MARSPEKVKDAALHSLNWLPGGFPSRATPSYNPCTTPVLAAGVVPLGGD